MDSNLFWNACLYFRLFNLPYFWFDSFNSKTKMSKLILKLSLDFYGFGDQDKNIVQQKQKLNYIEPLNNFQLESKLTIDCCDV